MLFFLPEFKIYDSSNQFIGSIKTRFGIVAKFEIYDKNGKLLFYCENGLIHRWTFNIFNSKSKETQIALISKKWSGIGKESFTKADNFLIDFDKITEELDKKIILSLSIIIDLFAFE